MKGSSIAGSRGRPKRNIDETIKNNLEINGLDRDVIHDRVLIYGVVWSI